MTINKKTQPYLFEDDVDHSKPKKTVKDEIYKINYHGEEQDIPFGDLPKDLQPTDILRYISDPGHYTDNNSWDPYTEIKVLRPRLETDDEQAERIERSRLFVVEAKERRHKNYLRLKEEFDPKIMR